MAHKHPGSSHVTVIAASLVSAVLGSIHAFSVFLAPLETQFGTSRSAVSLTYSMALMALTVAVLFGPRIYGRWSAASIMWIACTLAAAGALIAGTATSLPVVWVGYSLIFGLANGLGYGFGLQLSAQVSLGREGVAMGIVTAAYAFGAIISPILFEQLITSYGFRAAMIALAGTLVITGFISAALLRSTRVWYQTSATNKYKLSVTLGRQAMLWLAYFGGVLAGLMVIGHAAGIAAQYRPDLSPWVTPMVIASCNLMGSLVAGRLADRMALNVLLTSLALITALALIGVILFGQKAGLLIGFGVIGFAYGGTIAAYPAAIAKLFGMADSARIYGRIFTAWGAAGLMGPWSAGFLYDAVGDYRFALFVATGAAVTSAMTVVLLFRKPS